MSDGNEMPPRKAFTAYVVRVQLPRRGVAGQAFIYDEKHTLGMYVPAGLVSKRFRPGEMGAYFRADLDGDGILEIGERVGDRTW